MIHTPPLRYLSVCSGIEAATVAWHPLGFEPVAFAEVDKFPAAVLAHHYPTVPNYGDMTRFEEWPDANIYVLVGGTPCQSFSVAGLRCGLADPRGNLMLVYLGVADRFRPVWLVWENVPGVLSSNGGRDFGAFLGALGQLGYGWAYRVLDAQYFGLAQRRARVFVVASLGDWRRAAAVLFERESLSGHPAPRRATGEDATHTLASRTRSGGGYGPETECPVVPVLAASTGEVSHCLNAGGMGRIDYETETLIAHSLRAARFQVRRLSPRECERLQGFPDDYTLIPYRGKPAADGPRYKALGNSMAVPVMRWIGRRLAMVDALDIPQEKTA